MNSTRASDLEQAETILFRVFETWAALRAHLSPPAYTELAAALQAVPATIKAGLAQEFAVTDAALDALGQAVNSPHVPELQRAVYGVFARMLDGIQGPALQPLLCKAMTMFTDAAATQSALLHQHFQRAREMANTILTDPLSAGLALET